LNGGGHARATLSRDLSVGKQAIVRQIFRPDETGAGVNPGPLHSSRAPNSYRLR